MTRNLSLWQIDTPWDRPPLTANQRLHWTKRAELTRTVRTWAAYTFNGARFPNRPVTVDLTWHVPDRRRRDADNLVPTLKALCDGLVDAGVAADDTPDLMHKRMPRIIHTPGEPARLILTIQEATDA